MKKVVFGFLFLFVGLSLRSQSLELFPGNRYLFTDVQFLKNFDPAYRLTLFNRSRAQIYYADEPVNFFSGSYFNYTFKAGLGPSVIGRFNNSGADADVGLHYFKQSKTLTFFGIASLSLTSGGIYSWFSILRYRPPFGEKLKGFFALELFTAMKNADHLVSTQRVRVGLGHRGFQFGLAANLQEVGNGFDFLENNFGGFVRKEF